MNDSRYKLALKVVAGVVREWDPYDLLKLGSPNDEFDAEIASVVAQIPRIKSAQDAAHVLSRVFSSAFEPAKLTPHDCREAGAKLFESLSQNGLLPGQTDVKCSHCGTSDFSMPGKAFLMALRCRGCQIVFCVNCAGKEAGEMDETHFESLYLVCPKCRGHGIESVPEVN